MDIFQERYRCLFPRQSNGFWNQVLNQIEHITEVRIRVNSPIIIYHNQREISLDEEGNFLYAVHKGYRFDYNQLQNLINFWCMDSRYAFNEEMKRGYITVKGGHRIGICGEIICDQTGKLQSIKYISSINMRIAHEIKGVADVVYNHVCEREQIKNTLIIAPPGMGKTTLLRDLLRKISYGEDEKKGRNVAVVDERGEIAACFQGIPQLDVGPKTDVMDQCEKKIGMQMLLQSMAPQVIAVDELVSKKERKMIRQMINRGCAVIATIHGEEQTEDGRLRKWYDGFQIIIFLLKKEGRFETKIYRVEEGKRCKDYLEQYVSSQDV